MIALQLAQGEAEGFDRAFQPFEQVDGHQGLEATFAVGLLQLTATAGHLGIVELFVFGKPAGQDVTDRGIDRQLAALIAGR